MSAAWSNGSTRRWRKQRAAVLLRDGGRCQLAIPGVCVGVADCVHHTRGKSATGDDPRFLVGACTPCNLKVGKPKVDPPPQPRTAW